MPSYTTSSSSEYFITSSIGTTAVTATPPPPVASYPPMPPPLRAGGSKKKAVPGALEDGELARASELLVYYKRNHAPGRYEEGHRHNGETAYQNVQDLLARFFISVHYNAGPINNWREWCIGMTSCVIRDNLGRRLPEIMHMPMFDYDGKNIKSIVRKDVQQLQKKWGLGPATLFQTKKGFHVYFMTDMVSWNAYQNMLSEVKCCNGFRNCALKAGYAVLRVSAKYSTFDITLDSVMQPEAARALPFRKIRKARIVEALLSLGERCGTHFASLCPEWAHYHEDIEPWKQSTRSKRATGKMPKTSVMEGVEKALGSSRYYPPPPSPSAQYDLPPGKKGTSVGKPKGKLVLKPPAPHAAPMAEYYNPALPKKSEPLSYPVEYGDSDAIAKKMASVKYEYIAGPNGPVPRTESCVAGLGKIVADMNQVFSNLCRDALPPSRNKTIEYKKYKSGMFDSMNYIRPPESPLAKSEDSYIAVQKDAFGKVREIFYQSTKDLADET